MELVGDHCSFVWVFTVLPWICLVVYNVLLYLTSSYPSVLQVICPKKKWLFLLSVNFHWTSDVSIFIKLCGTLSNNDRWHWKHSMAIHGVLHEVSLWPELGLSGNENIGERNICQWGSSLRRAHSYRAQFCDTSVEVWDLCTHIYQL